jgi:hypothetical protein
MNSNEEILSMEFPFESNMESSMDKDARIDFHDKLFDEFCALDKASVIDGQNNKILISASFSKIFIRMENVIDN